MKGKKATPEDCGCPIVIPAQMLSLIGQAITRATAGLPDREGLLALLLCDLGNVIRDAQSYESLQGFMEDFMRYLHGLCAEATPKPKRKKTDVDWFSA
jgi:hypothetical protein